QRRHSGHTQDHRIQRNRSDCLRRRRLGALSRSTAIWWRRAAISAWRAVWVRNVEAKSVNSAMKTGLILKLDDLINWCNSRVFSSDEVFGNHRHTESASEQEFVRSGILRGFLDFLKNDVFGVRDGHTLRFQQ